MTDAEAMTEGRGDESSTDYTRFIILSGARTGSNMLASSLNSSPEIVCFRELFNYAQKEIIDFHVEGYDPTSAEDRALRDGSYREFLRQRVFCSYSSSVRAVGFKLLYDHVWGYEGLLEWLNADDGLRVIHLRRRNALRAFVSLRIAITSGRWYEARSSAGRANVDRAGERRVVSFLRTAVEWLQRFIPRGVVRKDRQQEQHNAQSALALKLSPDECRFFFRKNEWDEGYFSKFFAKHPTHEIFYEDIANDDQDVQARVQEFLGVTPRSLEAGTRRQNPQPLRELIANFDELHEAFKGTPDGWLFEDAE